MKIVIKDCPSEYTNDSVLILNDDNKGLFSFQLLKNDELLIHGIDSLASKIHIKPRAANSIILKLDQ